MAETANRNSGVDSPRAWIVVGASFIACTISFGVAYAFGVFLKPLSQTFNANHALLSTLFSTLSVLSYLLGPITGRLSDRFGPRPVLAAGAVLMGGGLMLSARVQWFPLLYVTYGVCLGVAMACIYVPLIAAVGEWFQVDRDMALGIAVTGTGLGTLLGAPAAARLITRFGWRDAFQTFGWISLLGLLACSALMLRPPIARKQDSVDVTTKMRTRPFVLLYLGLGFRGIALFVTIVFLPVFAMDIGASHAAAAGLIGYLGAASIAGRVGLNALAPKLGLMNTYLLSCVILLVGCVIWVMSRSYVPLIAFALAMGVGYGANAAMTPAVAAAKFGIEGLGRLLGWLYTSFAVACLIGPPLAGVLADVTHDYRFPVMVALFGGAASLAAIVPLREPRPPELETAAAD